MLVIEKMRIRVDIIDGAAVNSNGSEDAGIRRDAGQIGTHVAPIEEDGPTGIAALDGTVEVVPLIDPADRGVGLLNLVQTGERFAASDLAEKSESAVENAAVIGGRDDDVLFVVDTSKG